MGSRSVTLSWHDGGDPDNQPRNYRDYYVEVWKTGWSRTLNWTTNTSWQVTVPSDGVYSWHVMAGDGAAGSAWSETRTFNVDASSPAAPTITVGGAGCAGIQNNGWQRTCYDPAFTWSATDVSGSGIHGYLYCGSVSPNCNPTTWTTNTSFNPPAIASPGGVGSYYFNVKARDNLNHDSSVATFGVRYDGSVPTVTLQINGGAATANQTSILLNLSAGDTGSGISAVRISNNALDWSPWQPYADAIPWTLPALDRRALTVYVQVRDRAENESAVASDAITLDLYPPAPHSANYRICASVVDAAGRPGITSSNYSLVSAVGQPWATGATADASPGFEERAGFLANVTGCLPISYSVTSNFTVTRWVIASGGNLRGNTNYRLGDTVGQAAASGTDAFTSTSYILSSGFWAQITGTVPPTTTVPPMPVPITPTATPTPGPTPAPQPGSFGVSINGGALFTNDPVVMVHAWAPNVTYMRLSNDGGFADSYWQTYRITTTWVLSTYASYATPRIVYVQFQDAGGAIYGTYVDDIIYDPVAPEGSVSILGGETVTVTLWLEAWDDNSGVDQMRVSEEAGGQGTAWLPYGGAPWQPYTNTITWVLQSDVVYAQFQDRAGNASPIYGTDGSVHIPDAKRIYLPLVLRQSP